jgi:hypothetical protein
VEEQVTRASAGRRLALLAGLFLALAAASSSGAGGAPGLAARGKGTSLAPLFDTHTRFKPKKTVDLRFRATDKGVPVALEDISFSLRHRPGDAPVPLPARELKKGVFVVPFTPAGPGQYTVAAAVRGRPPDAIPEVRLGVVGLADGLVEEPPEADAQAKRRARISGRSR